MPSSKFCFYHTFFYNVHTIDTPYRKTNFLDTHISAYQYMLCTEQECLKVVWTLVAAAANMASISYGPNCSRGAYRKR